MRIDVHHHLLPPPYVDAVGLGRIGALSSAGTAPAWSVEHALEAMDRNSVDLAVTSISAPGFVLDTGADLAAVVRRCNEFSAQMVADRPHRFGMFAALPLPDIAATLSEVDFSYTQLQTDGVCMLSNYDGLYLGDPTFTPVFEALDRHAAAVFVHPTGVKGAPVIPGVSQSTLEFPFDTTRTVASLLFGGVLSRFPHIRFIFAHAGGAIPYLVHRMELLSRNAPSLRAPLRHGVVADLARHYYDTTLSAGPTTLAALMAFVPVEHVLFGTDFPFGPPDQMALGIRGLDALDLSPAARAGIDGENAVRLMPSLARALRK